jgi:ComF family protein
VISELIARAYRLGCALLSPPRCFYCYVGIPVEKVFCAACQASIQPVVSLQLSVTKKRSITVHSVGVYQEPLRSLIMAKHWSDPCAAKALGRLIAKQSKELNVTFDCVVPVPLHWTRYASRGFNQARTIADVVAKEHGVPVMDIIKRKRMTEYQAKLAGSARVENVADCFELADERFVGMLRSCNVLLVDDLVTTGATVISVAKVFKTLGVASITCLSVARAV